MIIFNKLHLNVIEIFGKIIYFAYRSTTLIKINVVNYIWKFNYHLLRLCSWNICLSKRFTLYINEFNFEWLFVKTIDCLYIFYSPLVYQKYKLFIHSNLINASSELFNCRWHFVASYSLSNLRLSCCVLLLMFTLLYTLEDSPEEFRGIRDVTSPSMLTNRRSLGTHRVL